MGVMMLWRTGHSCPGHTHGWQAEVTAYEHLRGSLTTKPGHYRCVCQVIGWKDSSLSQGRVFPANHWPWVKWHVEWDVKLYLLTHSCSDVAQSTNAARDLGMYIKTLIELKKEAGFVQRPIMRSSPPRRSGMDHTVVTLQTHHTRLYIIAFTRWRHHCSDSNHLRCDYITVLHDFICYLFHCIKLSDF